MRNSPSRPRGKPPWKLSGRPLATPGMPPAKLRSEKADRSSVDGSELLDARRESRPIEPKNLHMMVTAMLFLVDASAADHLWMAGRDRRLEHSILGELAGPSGCLCPRICQLHAETGIRRW